MKDAEDVETIKSRDRVQAKNAANWSHLVRDKVYYGPSVVSEDSLTTLQFRGLEWEPVSSALWVGRDCLRALDVMQMSPPRRQNTGTQTLSSLRKDMWKKKGKK